jgi:citrate synthase
MRIRQSSVQPFFAFANNKAYLAGIGHRIAAIEDPRLLPVTQIGDKKFSDIALLEQ